MTTQPDLIERIEDRAKAWVDDVRGILADHEATVDRAAEDAQAMLQSPVAAAAAAAVHVPDSVLGKIAELIGAAEAEYAKLAGPEPVAAPAPDASQENLPEPGPPMAAGPVIGGQAS